MRYYLELVKYIFQSKYRKGFGIHSPSVFRLVTLVIEEDLPYYKFSLVEKVRSLTKNKLRGILRDNEDESLRQLPQSPIQKCLYTYDYEQLLFRLVNYYKPDAILEIGLATGFSTMYLAAPNSKATVTTISDSALLEEFSNSNFKSAGIENVEFAIGDIYSQFCTLMKTMSRVKFISINCRMLSIGLFPFYDEIDRLFKGEGGVLVLNEPYWTDAHRKDLKKISSHTNARVVIDLFHVVIVLFDKNLQKEYYKLRYFTFLR